MQLENTNERLYSFQNFYFSGIHAGIQTAHSIARMSQKYAATEGFVILAEQHDLAASDLFHNWAKREGGETIIIKNGGMQGDLENLLQFLESEEHPYPYDYFHESQYAAGGAFTNVSIVLPDTIWKVADALRAGQDILYTSKSNTHYAFMDITTGKFSPMTPTYETTCDVHMISRRQNLQQAEQEKRPPGLFPNEVMLTFTDFEVQLMTRMNKSGLMS